MIRDGSIRSGPPGRRGVLTICRVLGTLWMLVPPLGFSSLLHIVDPDVGGGSGLASPGVAFSTVIVSVPLVVLASICLLVFRAGGWAAGGGALLLSATAVGAILTAAGSAAGTIGGHLVSFAGLTVAVAGCLAVAVLPWALLSRDPTG